MKEVINNLYIGTIEEYEAKVQLSPSFKTVIAAKEPYHREYVGYKTRGCPKENPYYYIAEMKDGIICNLIDSDKKEYIPDEIMIPAVKYIRRNLENGEIVFVCCNQGKSRSPVMALLSAANTTPYNSISFEEAYEKLRNLHPFIEAGNGIYEYARENWTKFQGNDL